MYLGLVGWWDTPNLKLSWESVLLPATLIQINFTPGYSHTNQFYSQLLSYKSVLHPATLIQLTFTPSYSHTNHFYSQILSFKSAINTFSLFIVLSLAVKLHDMSISMHFQVPHLLLCWIQELPLHNPRNCSLWLSLCSTSKVKFDKSSRFRWGGKGFCSDWRHSSNHGILFTYLQLHLPSNPGHLCWHLHI